MDKLKKSILTNKKILVFLFFLFLISIVFGSVLPLCLNDFDKGIVRNYLSDFILSIESLNPLSLLFNGFIGNCGFLIVLWILGISVIGCVIVLFLFFLKGFILGFSVSSIIINYGVKGILISFIYLFPHQIINICVYGFMTCYSIIFSLKFILFLFKKCEFNVREAFKKYFKLFCFNLLFLILSILYEAFLWPKLMGFVCKSIGL